MRSPGKMLREEIANEGNGKEYGSDLKKEVVDWVFVLTNKFSDFKTGVDATSRNGDQQNIDAACRIPFMLERAFPVAYPAVNFKLVYIVVLFHEWDKGSEIENFGDRTLTTLKTI